LGTDSDLSIAVLSVTVMIICDRLHLPAFAQRLPASARQG